MKATGLTARHKPETFEAVDRQARKACPWQRTRGVVDHQMVDVVMRDAGLGAEKHGNAADAPVDLILGVTGDRIEERKVNYVKFKCPNLNRIGCVRRNPIS